MRLVDVLLASVLLGLALGYLSMDRPKADAAGETRTAAAGCGHGLCERITWLRTPAMRPAPQVR